MKIMKMMDLSRAFYRECILPALREDFPQIADTHAAALIGYGSEVLGNDDEISKFYGWGPRVNLFLTKEDHRLVAERIKEVLWANLPWTFMGCPARFKPDPQLGAPRPTDDPDGTPLIAITTSECYAEWYTGHSAIPVSPLDWLLIPEPRLLELSSGEVFHDGIGALTKLREYFHYFPEDVWRHPLAYQWKTLPWDIDLIGLCAARNDTLSSRICTNRSVERIIGLVFLLSQTYKPGYLKWVHRQFYKLPHLAREVGPSLEEAVTSKDCRTSLEILYSALDLLVEFQAGLGFPPNDSWKKDAPWGRGFFQRNLDSIITTVRQSISGPLADLSFQVGAPDQWVGDWDLLYLPEAMKSLRHVYSLEDPTKDLYVRGRLEDQGI